MDVSLLVRGVIAPRFFHDSGMFPELFHFLRQKTLTHPGERP
jgi:hypothetical protein